MTIGRRITGSISGMLVLLLGATGLGIGVMAWLRSWHDEFLQIGEQTGTLGDPRLQDMLGALSTGATVVIVLMGVFFLLCAGLGVTALVRLGPTVDRRLKSAVSGISDSVSELLTVVSQVAASASQTAGATTESTTTVEEVKQTTLLAQEKAAEASGLAQTVVDTSEAGAASAERNRVHFEQILAEMDEVAGAVDRLNENAQAVGEVIATVNDLAEQSNLLSVNASIEAAKSGEAGKGFSVVAQEVKSLAEQSKRAVARVREVLSETEKANEVVVHAVSQARETVESGRDETINAVERNVARLAIGHDMAEATLQISATGRQQLAGMEQIGQAMASIEQAGKHSVLGTRQVEQEVERLRELASELKNLIERKVAKE